MENRVRSRRRPRRKWLRTVVIVCALCLIGGLLVNGNWRPPAIFEEGSVTKDNSISEEWYLIVVNRWNEIPSDYSVTLTVLSNGQKVDSRIYPYLQEMFDDARSQGIYPFVREGYRTTEEQRAIFDERIQEYIDAGNSEKAARELTEKWVAVPGTSEHQLGISVDINADVSKSTSEDVYKWLAENAYQYGFILRYPQGKEDITGTAYEPWHYRYVGLEAAKEIYEQGICLEEYVQTDLPAS